MTGDGLHYEDVEIGDEIGPLQRVVTDQQISRFVAALGVPKDLSWFTDEEIARKERFPGPIVPGAMTMALMSQLLTGWSMTVLVKSLDVIFRQMVPRNTLVLMKAIVIDKVKVCEDALLECDILIEDEDGVRLAIGSATVALPTRQ